MKLWNFGTYCVPIFDIITILLKWIEKQTKILTNKWKFSGRWSFLQLYRVEQNERL